MMPGNPVLGSTVLRVPAAQSPNYVAGESGWFLGQDGFAQFCDVEITGTDGNGNSVVITGNTLIFTNAAGQNMEFQIDTGALTIVSTSESTPEIVFENEVTFAGGISVGGDAWSQAAVPAAYPAVGSPSNAGLATYCNQIVQALQAAGLMA